VASDEGTSFAFTHISATRDKVSGGVVSPAVRKPPDNPATRRSAVPVLEATTMFRKLALVLLSFLLMASGVLAGDKVRAGKPTITQPQQVSAPATRVTPAAVTVTVVIQPAQTALAAPLSVALRGPDGQVRRFAVEGGRQAIQVRSVVLRPGESVAIRWVPPKE
jgi:hypothetical protein